MQRKAPAANLEGDENVHDVYDTQREQCTRRTSQTQQNQSSQEFTRVHWNSQKAQGVLDPPLSAFVGFQRSQLQLRALEGMPETSMMNHLLIHS